MRSRGAGCFLNNQAASVITGQHVHSGGERVASVSTQSRCQSSFAEQGDQWARIEENAAVVHSPNPSMWAGLVLKSLGQSLKTPMMPSRFAMS